MSTKICHLIIFQIILFSYQINEPQSFMYSTVQYTIQYNTIHDTVQYTIQYSILYSTA